MNDQSLQAANAFLAIASANVQSGEFLDRSPAEIGREAGLPNPLSVARAVRALAARKRLAVEEGRYRLLDGRPLEPGEPESVPRAPRRRKPRRRSSGRSEPPAASDRRASYADLGRSIVERVIELGRDSGEAVAAADHLRREAKENKAARIEAEGRAGRLFERVKELEAKLEMAEANLRTVLAAARGRGATAAPTDGEMEALLRILKTPGADEPEPHDQAAPERPGTSEEATAGAGDEMGAAGE